MNNIIGFIVCVLYLVLCLAVIVVVDVSLDADGYFGLLFGSIVGFTFQEAKELIYSIFED